MTKWKDDPAYALNKAFEEDVKKLIESITSSGLRHSPIVVKEKKKRKSKIRFRTTYRLVDALR